MTVAFTACISEQDRVNIGHLQTIVFDLVKTNVGNAYKGTSGIFIAPVSGVYGFHLSAMVTVDHVIYLNIIKNGVNFDVMVAEGHGRVTTVTEFWTIELQTNDLVWIQSDTTWVDGHITALHGWCNSVFSGFLIGV
ncbi:hypothetical protein DPMN_155013 [Dreissena polymorpha]|uniref:C1q domain-containing protein n=1 Tax=Dreissena polymorpha TaxID=45954 RepID=A0A9D4J9M8_DREPO|nr:hypothetical protein DPMN_155013 [Dreissena polymorpha]